MSTSRKPRKNYTPAEKIALLRRHLIEKVPVSGSASPVFERAAPLGAQPSMTVIPVLTARSARRER